MPTSKNESKSESWSKSYDGQARTHTGGWSSTRTEGGSRGISADGKRETQAFSKAWTDADGVSHREWMSVTDNGDGTETVERGVSTTKTRKRSEQSQEE